MKDEQRERKKIWSRPSVADIQFIPVRSSLGLNLSVPIKPKAGTVLSQVDYAGIELRIMAHYMSKGADVSYDSPAPELTTEQEKAEAIRGFSRLASIQSVLYRLFGTDFWDDLVRDADAAIVYDAFMAHRRKESDKK